MCDSPIGKRQSYLEWTDYFMAMAFLAAKRSKDPSTQVGCCIVNEDKKIVALGYNGFPIGCSDDVSRGHKYFIFFFFCDFVDFRFHQTHWSKCRNSHGARKPAIRCNRNSRTCVMLRWMLCSIKIRPIWRIAACMWHYFHATNVPKWSFNRASRKLFICPINMRRSPKWLHRRECWTQPAFNTHSMYRRVRKLLSILRKSIGRKTSINCRPRRLKNHRHPNELGTHQVNEIVLFLPCFFIAKRFGIFST